MYTYSKFEEPVLTVSERKMMQEEIANNLN
jgi:hypothetical protein